MKPMQSIHIGFAAPDSRLAFWAIVGYGAKEQATQLGVKLSVTPVTTAAEQVGVIQQFVRQRVDALIVGPVDLDGIAAAVAQARAAGIPVIAVDVEIPGSHARSTVGSDNICGAALGAEHLCGQIGGRSKVIHLQGTAGSPSAAQRSQGFHDVLARYPDVELVFEARGNWTSESGAALTRKALANDPDLRGVFAANDPMALGAAAAIEEAGRSGEVCIVGFDALPEALFAIHGGRMNATVGQDPRSMGRIAVESAVRGLRGEGVASHVWTDTTLVTADTLIHSALNALQIMPLVMRDVAQQGEEQRRLQAQVIAAQDRVIQELSSPIIPVSDKILVLPLIGTIDSARANAIMESMLQAISKHHAQMLIIDITGVPVVDTMVAHHLLQSIRAVQLLGAQALLVGITPNVAQVIVQLGIDLSSVMTHSSLQTGLEWAMKQVSVGV